MTNDRSASALETDRLQEQIVHSGRVWQLWGLIAILAIGVGVAVWQDVSAIYIIAGIAAWVVLSFHFSFTAILHELYELTTVPLIIEQIQLVRHTAPFHCVVVFRKQLN